MDVTAERSSGDAKQPRGCRACENEGSRSCDAGKAMRSIPVVTVALLGMLAASCGGESKSMAPAEVERLLESYAASATPAYFLGDGYAGLPITNVSRDEGVTLIVYGTCNVAPFSEGGCAPPLQVQTRAFSAEAWSRAVGCSRLADIGGVPSIDFGGGTLLVLDGLTVTVFDDTNDTAESSAAAADVRRVGQAAPGPLQRPKPADLALVDKACGAQPGEHGPPV